MGKLSLRVTLSIWAIVTAAGCLAYVLYLRTLPPDELVMANTVSFQVLLSLCVIGLPSLVVLLVFLFGYPVARDSRARRRAG